MTASLPKSRLSFITINLITLLLFATHAFAAQPQTFSETDTANFTSSCSYGDLNWSTTITSQQTLFLEPTPQATKLVWHFSATTTITNPLNGKTATGSQHSSETLYGKNGDFATVGLNMGITVPGYGTVLTVAGKLVTDFQGNVVFSTPQWRNLDTTSLCNALQ